MLSERAFFLCGSVLWTMSLSHDCRLKPPRPGTLGCADTSEGRAVCHLKSLTVALEWSPLSSQVFGLLCRWKRRGQHSRKHTGAERSGECASCAYAMHVPPGHSTPHLIVTITLQRGYHDLRLLGEGRAGPGRAKEFSQAHVICKRLASLGFLAGLRTQSSSVFYEAVPTMAPSLHFLCGPGSVPPCYPSPLQRGKK